MNADGSNRRVLALAKPAPDCTRPSWSPDGAYIAYQGFDGTNFRQVYAIRSNGAGAPTRVTNDEEPARMGVWSPDGSKILYASEDGYLYTTAVERGPLGLTFGAPEAVVSGWMGTMPDWSPDGTRLASRRYDLPELRGIWTIDSSDGGNPQQVTFGGHLDTEPAWSPDGTRIAFSRSLDGKGWQLFQTAADGGGEPVGFTQARDGYVWFFSPDWQPRP
jgi:TolB protein